MANAQSTRSFGPTKAQRDRINRLALDARAMRLYPDADPCAYCGVIANSVDHVPPRSQRDRLVALGLALQYDFFEVPACRECNSVLGARPLWTLRERRAYIKRMLKRRYADVLKIPDWTDSELAQMSPMMQTYILNGIEVREFIRQRVQYHELSRGSRVA